MSPSTATQRVTGDVLLVGSLPFETSEAAFRSVAEGLGDLVSCIPDGEPGIRQFFVGYLPQMVFSSHPDLFVVHAPPPGDPQEFHSDDEGVIAGSAPEFRWTFGINEGVTDLEFDLGYDRFALESWEAFKKLRDDGVIPAGTAFQVALPTSSTAVDVFFETEADRRTARKAYVAGIKANVEKILETIPAEDVVFQLDIPTEVTDLSIGDRKYFSFWEEHTYEEKLAYYVEAILELVAVIPEEAPLGIHHCYGTWGGWPMVELGDLSLCVDLSNRLVAGAKRKIDYMHIPVDVTADDAFYAPLADLDIGDTKVYLGMVHFHEESTDAFSERVATVKKFLPEFGISAVCGYGRTDPEQVGNIFAMHAQCVKLMHGTK